MGQNHGMTPTDSGDRTRTISWTDPMLAAATVGRGAGIDFMRALQSGEIAAPPMIVLMNMQIASIEPGAVAFTVQPDESHYNPLGVIHGGYACTVLDTAAGCAVHTTLPAGVGYTSLEIKVNYLRGLSSTTGPLTATGRVVKPGSRVAFAEAELTDSEGRVVATASSTCLVFPVAAS
jgi:uncharacterized protein (TIGR00369 family)